MGLRYSAVAWRYAPVMGARASLGRVETKKGETEEPGVLSVVDAQRDDMRLYKCTLLSAVVQVRFVFICFCLFVCLSLV